MMSGVGFKPGSARSNTDRSQHLNHSTTMSHSFNRIVIIINLTEVRWHSRNRTEILHYSKPTKYSNRWKIPWHELKMTCMNARNLQYSTLTNEIHMWSIYSNTEFIHGKLKAPVFNKNTWKTWFNLHIEMHFCSQIFNMFTDREG